MLEMYKVNNNNKRNKLPLWMKFVCWIVNVFLEFMCLCIPKIWVYCEMKKNFLLQKSKPKNTTSTKKKNNGIFIHLKMINTLIAATKIALINNFFTKIQFRLWYFRFLFFFLLRLSANELFLIPLHSHKKNHFFFVLIVVRV